MPTKSELNQNTIEESNRLNQLSDLSVRWLKNKIIPTQSPDQEIKPLKVSELTTLLDNNFAFWLALSEEEKKNVSNEVDEQRIQVWKERDNFIVNVFSSFDQETRNQVIGKVTSVTQEADESWREIDSKLSRFYKPSPYNELTKRLTGLSVAIGKIRGVYYSQLKKISGPGFEMLSVSERASMIEQMYVIDFGMNSDGLLQSAGLNGATDVEMQQMMGRSPY